MATCQLEEAILSIEERQSGEEIASIIQDLGRKKRGLLNSYRKTVAYAVMKWLEAIKAGKAKGTRASAFPNMILQGTWRIAIPDCEEATEEDGTGSVSDKEITIRQLQASPS